VILRQLLHTDPVIAASYVVGCGGKSACVVIDPVDAPERYLEVGARALSGATVSTLGFERRFNRSFAIETEDAFVAAMVRDIRRPPPNAGAIRAANLGLPAAGG
jgi:hypothetical protein